MKYLLISLLMISSMASAANIKIDADEDDCIDGWISMDINVSVNGERFNFDPSCNFSFDDTIKTSSGMECRVEAGMCSSFSPQKRFEVTCDDGSSEEIPIKCK